MGGTEKVMLQMGGEGRPEEDQDDSEQRSSKDEGQT